MSEKETKPDTNATNEQLAPQELGKELRAQAAALTIKAFELNDSGALESFNESTPHPELDTRGVQIDVYEEDKTGFTGLKILEAVEHPKLFYAHGKRVYRETSIIKKGQGFEIEESFVEKPWLPVAKIKGIKDRGVRGWAKISCGPSGVEARTRSPDASLESEIDVTLDPEDYSKTVDNPERAQELANGILKRAGRFLDEVEEIG